MIVLKIRVRQFLRLPVLMVLTGMLLVGFLLVHFAANHRFPRENKVRIAFNAKSSVTAFDPARIQMDIEAIVLDNLYSPLVRMATDGTIEPFFAEHYFWVGNTVHFKVRANFRTVDGWLVTAKDAEFSIRRILISDSNAHGSLAMFLCPDARPTSIDSHCAGIESTESELKLTVVNAKYKPFLLKLLSSMDFGIVPQAACNPSSPKHEILNYRNTTGPYYVSKDDPKGAFVLTSNPNHWLKNSGLPEELEFVPANPQEAISLIRAGKVDFISCINVEPSQELETLKAEGKFNFFETYPIRKFMIASSHSKLKDFSVAERHAVHQMIRNAFLGHAESVGWSASIDFFPPLGEGALNRSQMSELKKTIASSENTRIHRKVTVGVGRSRLKLFTSILKDFEQLEVVPITNMAPFLPESERPDFYILGTDSSFHESFSLISYNVVAELVSLSRAESVDWLRRYMEFEDKTDRIAMLKDLNFETLQSGVIGVIGEAPYIEVSRKPFRYQGSKFFAGSPLWLIRQD